MILIIQMLMQMFLKYLNAKMFRKNQMQLSWNRTKNMQMFYLKSDL